MASTKIQCPNCEGMVVVDRSFYTHLQDTLARTTLELVAFCAKKKIDHTKLPVLEELGRAIRILQEIE